MKRKTVFKILSPAGGIILSAVLFCLIISSHVVNVGEKNLVSVSDAVSCDTPCIIVLGAMVRDGKPSLMLRDRLERAIQIYFQNDASFLLMSGDCSGEDYNEVEVMKQYAIDSGVPEEDIILDPEGYSTYESITRLKSVYGYDSAIIVSQEYHLYRALYIAEKNGIQAVGVAAENISYYGQSGRDFREVLARCKDWFFTLFD